MDAFLYIVPLKQGLKPYEPVQCFDPLILFLYIVPLKQGLKLTSVRFFPVSEEVFIHSSIKTRIETLSDFNCFFCSHLVFIHSSIKTRIETRIRQ